MLVNFKLQTPKLQNEIELVEKEIPEELLDNRFPVCVFCHPFGSGKTTMVTRYAAVCQKMVLWYNLDVLDNQELVFLKHIRYLFSKVASDMQEHGTSELNPPYSWLEEMQVLIGELNGALELQGNQDYCLVLDSFQNVTNKIVLTMVEQLLEYRPKRLSVIVVTNQEVPSFLFRYVMNRRCLVLGKDELSWTLEETGNWILNVLPETSKARIQQIYEQVEGWPAGIIFLTEYLKHSKTETENLDWDEIFLNTYVGDYLDEQISRKNPEPELWRFLVTSSVPLNFTKESGMFVLDEDEYPAKLQKIFRGNWFLKYQDGTYHYTPFFREYLSRKCKADEKKEILTRLFSFYHKKQDYILAARYGLEGLLAEPLLNLLSQNGGLLLAAEEFTILGQVIGFLEGQDREFDLKSLEVIAQYAYGTGQYGKMETYLNQGDIQFGKENKFSAYRSLYKAMLQIGEDRERYGTQINNALFFLKENHMALPYLKRDDKIILKELEAEYQALEHKNGVRLAVRVFKTFEVTVIGSQRSLAWRTKKGRELFAYLIEIQGKPVERKQLIQVLWPEEIPDNAVAMLHNMIYNIRKDLSAYHLDGLVRYQDKKYSICMELIQKEGPDLDIISSIVEKKDTAGLLEKESSFTRYWGRYLEDIDSRWAEEQGNYYDKIYLEGCLLLAKFFSEQNDHKKAAVYYKNAGDLDPYSEEVEEMLLRCYRLSGDWKQMKKQYEEFRKLYKEDLGMEPSEKFELFYRTCSQP